NRMRSKEAGRINLYHVLSATTADATSSYPRPCSGTCAARGEDWLQPGPIGTPLGLCTGGRCPVERCVRLPHGVQDHCQLACNCHARLLVPVAACNPNT